MTGLYEIVHPYADGWHDAIPIAADRTPIVVAGSSLVWCVRGVAGPGCCCVIARPANLKPQGTEPMSTTDPETDRAKRDYFELVRTPVNQMTDGQLARLDSVLLVLRLTHDEFADDAAAYAASEPLHYGYLTPEEFEKIKLECTEVQRTYQAEFARAMSLLFDAIPTEQWQAVLNTLLGLTSFEGEDREQLGREVLAIMDDATRRSCPALGRIADAINGHADAKEAMQKLLAEHPRVFDQGGHADRICRQCNTVNAHDGVFCSACGLNLIYDFRGQRKAPEKPADAA